MQHAEEPLVIYHTNTLLRLSSQGFWTRMEQTGCSYKSCAIHFDFVPEALILFLLKIHD